MYPQRHLNKTENDKNGSQFSFVYLFYFGQKQKKKPDKAEVDFCFSFICQF